MNENNLHCQRHDLSNILKLQTDVLYSIYHQRAGKTSLFHMRGALSHILILAVPLTFCSETTGVHDTSGVFTEKKISHMSAVSYRVGGSVTTSCK